MAIVARPRYDQHKKQWWNGLVGIFPFARVVAAQRSSKNRAKGTMELKAIECVNGKEHEKMMIEHVLPALKEKWPGSKKETIYIQMDNVKPHTQAVDRRFHEAAKEGGWDIRIRRQPAKSPDVNTLDLGFFNSIQSLQYQTTPKNLFELVDSTKKAFYNQERVIL